MTGEGKELRCLPHWAPLVFIFLLLCRATEEDEEGSHRGYIYIYIYYIYCTSKVESEIDRKERG